MSVHGLGEAILAQVPRNVVATVHEGVVPGDARPPWVVAVLQLPNVEERALSSRPQSFDARVTLKVAAGTQDGVLMIFDDLLDLDGRRPSVEGWSCGPLLVFNVRVFDADRDVTFPGATQPPAWGLIEARCAVSRTPEV